MSSETPVDPAALREEMKSKYREVALNPHGAFHFHTGRPLAARLGCVDAFTDLESPTTVTEMISSYLDRPILSLAVTLPMLLQNVEAELANEVPSGSNCPARRLPSASR